jgi:hypothetical protein
MQARRLQSLLNTKRPIHLSDGKICIGSTYVYDLISVDVESLSMRYALSGEPHHSGDAELIGIWDKLKELIDTGILREIIDNNDPIEGMVPVYFYNWEGNIVESYTEPDNSKITYDGISLYDYTYFYNKKDAIKDGISHLEHDILLINNQISTREFELNEKKKLLETHMEWLDKIAMEFSKCNNCQYFTDLLLNLHPKIVLPNKIKEIESENG